MLPSLQSTWLLLRCMKPWFQNEGQCKAFNLKINFIFVQIYSVSQDRSYTKPHFESKGVKNLLKI